MEAIVVPGPPKSAFNKSRCISDLIRAQVSHFKHLEEKLPPEVRATLPDHRIITEDDAARYIAFFTRLLRSRAAVARTTTVAQRAAAPLIAAPISMRERAAAKPQSVDLAASGSPPPPSAPKRKPASAAKKGARGRGKRIR